jgi:hypothetical protein
MRWVLAVFTLALGSAIASPLIQPTQLELLCSSAGMSKVIVINDQGESVEEAHALDCTLCLPVSAPPPPSFRSDFNSPLAHATHLPVAARIAAHALPPLPARGPPTV